MINNILILIPCLNESRCIARVVAAARDAVAGADVAVVNDGSSDGTASEAASAGAKVLTHAVNLGYGAALETGYIFAFRSGYDLVLQLDGDGQHSARELSRLMAPVRAGTADIVIGSRYLGATDLGTIPGIRRAGHYLFRAMLRPLTGQRLTDPTSGFRALNRRALRFLTSGVFPCDYPDADVILMAQLSGLSIAEVPITVAPSPTGKSMHSGLKPIYYGIKMLLSIFITLLNTGTWRTWRRRHAAEDADGKGKP